MGVFFFLGIGFATMNQYGEQDAHLIPFSPMEDRIITSANRVKGKRAKTRPVKHTLNHNNAAQKPTKLQAEIRDQRDRTVAQCMLIQHRRFRKSLGARDHDVLRLHGFKHRCPNKAHIGRGQDDAHGKGRHQEACKAIHAAWRQQLESDGKQKNQHDRQPEVRE